MQPNTQFSVVNVNSNRGTSLIELVITLTIVAILSITAAPDLSNILRKNELITTSNNLRLSLSSARQHAMSNQVTVILCAIKSPNSDLCDTRRGRNADWSNGWILFADTNHNNQLDNHDILLQLLPNKSATTVIFNQRGLLRFFSNGGARSAGFYLCNDAKDAQRHIKLLYTGRTRVIAKMTKRHKTICASAASKEKRKNN